MKNTFYELVISSKPKSIFKFKNLYVLYLWYDYCSIYCKRLSMTCSELLCKTIMIFLNNTSIFVIQTFKK